MNQSGASDAPPRNRLLAGLNAADLAYLRPKLQLITLPFRQTMQTPDQPTPFVYFVESGYLSRLAPLEDGDSAEVGVIGVEGMTGIADLLGDGIESFETIVQMEGTALRIESAAFRDAVEKLPEFRAVLQRFALAHLEQIARTAACNGRHAAVQRLARWLLMVHDRVEQDTFPMTHEFLSMMLGIRRAGVTVAAGTLQKAGLIDYERGRITVVDRPGLEASCCECYGMARRSHERLLGYAPGVSRRYWQ